MDKRALAAAFRERLQLLLAEERGGVAGFLRDTGIDRSALSQFRDPEVDRLPRAETLRRIAEARGVTVDWLLSLSNAPEGRQEVTPSVQIESAEAPGGGSPIEEWRREAAGMKLRYVPSSLPDMLGLSDDAAGARRPAPGQPENVLGGFRLGEMDVEIAMPVQTLEDLAAGAGLWRGTDPAPRRRQLAHMAATCAETYPTLRLHLFDGRDDLRRALHRLRPHPRRGLPRRGLSRRDLGRAGRGAVAAVRQPGAPRDRRPGARARPAERPGRRRRSSAIRLDRAAVGRAGTR